MRSATIQLETLACPSCMQKIEAAIKKLEGVEEDTVKVLFNSSRVKLNYRDELISINQIENAITRLGYVIEGRKIK